MKNFKRNNRSNRDSRRPTMHRAICDECGKECEVPFKPTAGKPVLCSDCFRNRRKDSGRFNSGDKIMHKAVCDKCGKDCEVPFRPSKDKPIYCSQCFSRKSENKGSNQTNKQFEIINAKLDKILKELSSSISKTKISKPKKINKTKEKKVVSPKKSKTKKKIKK